MKRNKVINIVCICLLILVTGISVYLYVVNRNLNVDIIGLNERIDSVIFDKSLIEESKVIKANSDYSFKLRSEDGSNEAYHPKVISFKEEWNGYKYWMTYSPFPHGNAKYENPWIVASNDLINWVEPKGIVNPVEPTPTPYVHKKTYNSDPHIVYNSDKDELDLFFRFYDSVNDIVILYHKSSKDGINWTEKEALMERDRTQNDFFSPTVIYENGTYKLWYVEKTRDIMYSESKDLHKWSKPRIINIEYYAKDVINWHLDVIHTKKGYEMVISSYKNWADRNSMDLYYTYSKDNKKYDTARVILRPSVDGWDNKGIYRASLLYENGIYYLYYSGQGIDQTRGIGLAMGENIFNLRGLTK